MVKREYVAPVVVVYGDVKNITKANSVTPNFLDGQYPRDTPATDPIWSVS